MSETEAVYVEQDNWSREVMDSETPVLLDFGAEWCGPCRSLSPIMDELAQELAGKIKVAKVDVDEHPNIMRDFEVHSIPTLMVVVDGREEERLVGFTNKEDLLRRLKPYFEAA